MFINNLPSASTTFISTGSCVISNSNITSTSFSINAPRNGLIVDGPLVVKGKDIATTLERIEDRLAIISFPSPDKLEKFAALKKTYDQYKLLEKLLGDEQ